MVNLTYEEALQIVKNSRAEDPDLVKIAAAIVEARERRKGRPKKHPEPRKPPKHHGPR